MSADTIVDQILEKKGIKSKSDLSPEELGVINAIEKITSAQFNQREMRDFFIKEKNWADDNLLNECYNNNAKKDMFFRAYARLCKTFIGKVDSFNNSKDVAINDITKKYNL